jgi:lipoyl(octanoyl) transferase
MDLAVEWLGRMPYRPAWDRQRELVAARAADVADDTLVLVEHEAVLTLGRHATEGHVLATPAELAARGIEVVRVERGGEVTYHGPGQLVAYPIVRLAERGVLLRPFVRALEAAMADTAATYGVDAGPRRGHPGCWVDAEGPTPRKLGALGLRVERGVTFHGIALNVTTDLADFGLIDPCGIADLDVTSLARERGWTGEAAAPSTESVRVAGERFAAAFERRLAEAADAGRGERGAADGSASLEPRRPAVPAHDRAA